MSKPIQLVTSDELKVISDLALKLTELRQNECKHLCVNNAGNDIFNKLLNTLIDCKTRQEPFITCSDEITWSYE